MGAKKKTYSDFTGEKPVNLLDEPFYGYDLDAEQMAFANAIWDKDIDIVFCNARAGTGKTTIAVGVANMLAQYGVYDEIYNRAWE